MLLVLLFIASWVIPAMTHAETPDSYDRIQQLELRFDGRELRTRPLDPGKEYEVKINSRYTLRPLLDFNQYCQTYQQKDGWFSTTTFRICHLPLLVNGSLPSTVEPYGVIDPYQHVNNAYFLLSRFYTHYIPELVLFVWGTGRPLVLRTTHDFSEHIPTATAVIRDIEFYRAQERAAEEQQRREEERIRKAKEAAEYHEFTVLLWRLFFAAAGVFGVIVLVASIAQWREPVREQRRIARLRRQLENELTVLEHIKRGLLP